MQYYEEPLKTVTIRIGVYAEQYRNGIINIAGRKYSGYTMREAVKRWRKEHPIRRKTQ